MRIASFFSAALALLLAACSSDSESRLVAPSPGPSARATAVAMVSGNEQEAKAGERLVQPLVVRVTDAGGIGIRDAAVLFEVAGAGGLNGKDTPGSEQVSSQTDAGGHAQSDAGAV
jgi:hypothetical protein